MNIIRVLVYWHSYVHHGGFNLVHITYQVITWFTSLNHLVHWITWFTSPNHLVHITFQISTAVFGILIGPAVMFVMLQAGLSEVGLISNSLKIANSRSYRPFIQKVTGLESYISSIIISLPVFALAIAARFGTQKIQTWVVVFSSAIFALLFIVTFLYELVTGFIDLCFTSMIVITYSMVFGSYLVMSILHPR